MPRAPKGSGPGPTRQPGEKQRFEVLLGEMRSGSRTIAEAVTTLTGGVDQLDQSIVQLSQAIIELRLELKRHGERMDRMAERFEAHEKAHAAS